MKEIKLDVLGRVCIPKSMRENLNLKTDSTVCISQVDDKIIITKELLTTSCPVCSNSFSSEYQFCPYCGQYLIKKGESC